jgi:hypothetical protein
MYKLHDYYNFLFEIIISYYLIINISLLFRSALEHMKNVYIFKMEKIIFGQFYLFVASKNKKFEALQPRDTHI